MTHDGEKYGDGGKGTITITAGKCMPRGLPFGPGWEAKGRVCTRQGIWKCQDPGVGGRPELLSPPHRQLLNWNEVAAWKGLTLLLLVPKVRSCLAPELSALPVLPLLPSNRRPVNSFLPSSPSNKPSFLLSGFLEVERLC